MVRGEKERGRRGEKGRRGLAGGRQCERDLGQKDSLRASGVVCGVGRGGCWG